MDASILHLKTVPVLKQMCLEHNLRRTGRKADLIERLLDHQEKLQPWIPPEQPTPVVEWQLEKDVGLFDVLPEEMILKIISYLGPSDFAHLATVSRHFSGSCPTPHARAQRSWSHLTSHMCVLRIPEGRPAVEGPVRAHVARGVQGG